ncbi:MAG: hypothetical protein E5V92_30395 [Mesorhizobium sp.]|uniref:hypothetical protein n=1 Tax=unclassified Mesorhizobium TaxID=325217 RepID=UPI000F7548E7|nr:MULTISPECIES: hypothetical protein [unclassified Mesorhizobium]AZO70752.1 hypothetical protein EJ067_05755 [Mesorhizobium sp. M1D.F.Ca.ET.043.01.1.1]RWA89314.1 MAG: hypothetical protein EOQ32_20810 [Mesorhizobium sp.]RWE15277.1 MAG: hypothetical protein EOS61_10145 [Mesorhizobium sp.]TJW75586.1 MAG: hypothetical protein E5V92_30395 [Mesorhizobium sp.]
MDDDALTLRPEAKSFQGTRPRKDGRLAKPRTRRVNEPKPRDKQGSERVQARGAPGKLDSESRDRPEQGRRGFCIFRFHRGLAQEILTGMNQNPRRCPLDRSGEG